MSAPSKIESYCGIKFYRDIMGSTTHDDAEVAFNFTSCSAPSQARGSSLVEKLTLSVLDCRKFILIAILIKKISFKQIETIFKRTASGHKTFAMIWLPKQFVCLFANLFDQRKKTNPFGWLLPNRIFAIANISIFLSGSRRSFEVYDQAWPDQELNIAPT